MILDRCFGALLLRWALVLRHCVAALARVGRQSGSYESVLLNLGLDPRAGAEQANRGEGACQPGPVSGAMGLWGYGAMGLCVRVCACVCVCVCVSACVHARSSA